MSLDVLIQIAAVAIALGGVLVLVAAARHRKHRAQLARIAGRCAMNVSEGEVAPSLIDKAGHYAGRKRGAKLRDILVGHGESQGSFFARRRIGASSHQLLYFELGGSSHLDGFYVLPGPATGEKDHDFLLQWRAPQSQWNDERALSMAARVMHGLSRVGDRSGAAALGIELSGRKVWIYSRRSLRGEELDRFADDAMRLRQLLLRSLQRANEVSRSSSRGLPSAGSAPVTVLSP